MFLFFPLAPSTYGMPRDTFLIVRHYLSIVPQTDFIFEPVMFCFMVYNGKAAKMHCAVERDDFAEIKLVNNYCGDLGGFTVYGDRDWGLEQSRHCLT